MDCLIPPCRIQIVGTALQKSFSSLGGKMKLLSFTLVALVVVASSQSASGRVDAEILDIADLNLEDVTSENHVTHVGINQASEVTTSFLQHSGKRAAKAADISRVVLAFLHKNIAALRGEQKSISKDLEDAQNAQADAQNLYDQAKKGIGKDSSELESAAAKSSKADEACSEAIRVADAALKALKSSGKSSSSNDGQKVDHDAARREIAVIMAMKEKLDEVWINMINMMYVREIKCAL
jgi:hypothetical protein